MPAVFAKSVCFRALALAAGVAGCSAPETTAARQYLAGYFAELEREIVVAPCGNAIAVSCHNCYRDGDGAESVEQTAAATIGSLERAIELGLDLLELDVHESPSGLLVKHDTEDTGARLADVLRSSKLRNASQPLFIELKDPFVDEARSRSLLSALFETIHQVDLSMAAEAPDVAAKFIRAGRPIYIRAIRRLEAASAHRHLAYVDAVAHGLPHVAGNARVHVLLPNDVSETLEARLSAIEQAATVGVDAIELEYEQAGLAAGIVAAKHLGLGVGIYTLPNTRRGRAAALSLRESVDFITADARSVRRGAEPLRGLLDSETTVLYADVTNESAFPFQYCSALSGSRSMSSTRAPVMSLAASEFSYRDGGAMVFSGGEYARAEDPGGHSGLIIHSVLKFRRLTLRPLELNTIVARADGYYALQLAGEDRGTALRFVIHTNGRSFGIGCPTSKLDGDAFHMVTASIEVDGRMELWIDGRACATGKSVPAQARGSDVVTIGAEVHEGVVANGFEGELQQLHIQAAPLGR